MNATVRLAAMTDTPEAPHVITETPHVGSPLLLDDAVHGTVARFQPVAGATTAEDWIEIAGLAQDFGDGNVYLAQNAALELRGVHDVAQLVARVSAPALSTPSRPVLASPLSAVARELARDIAAVCEGLEAASEVLLGVDDGSGDIVAEGVDFGALLRGTDSAQLITQGVLSDAVLAIEDLVPALVNAIEEAAAKAPEEASADTGRTEELKLPATETSDKPAQPIGWLAEHTPEGRVDLGAGLHKGVIPAKFADLIGRLDVDITVTPWQGLVFHDIAEGDAEVVLRVLAPRGFIFDVNSPLL